MEYITAIGVAARIWCDQDYSHVIMNGVLAQKIARLLKKEADAQENKKQISPLKNAEGK
jgi:hypothetical protein